MTYRLPQAPAKSGIGKNQQRAFALLEGMHIEIADRLARQGRDNYPVLIEHEDWRQRCSAYINVHSAEGARVAIREF